MRSTALLLASRSRENIGFSSGRKPDPTAPAVTKAPRSGAPRRDLFQVFGSVVGDDIEDHAAGDGRQKVVVAHLVPGVAARRLAQMIAVIVAHHIGSVVGRQ